MYLSLVIGCILSINFDASDASKEELKKLEGEWIPVKDSDNKKSKESQVVVFKGDTVTFGKQKPSKFSIDISKDPKWIDVELSAFNTTLPGIYVLKDTELTIYLITEFDSDKPVTRPKSFDEKAPGQILRLKRRAK